MGYRYSIYLSRYYNTVFVSPNNDSSRDLVDELALAKLSLCCLFLLDPYMKNAFGIY